MPQLSDLTAGKIQPKRDKKGVLVRTEYPDTALSGLYLVVQPSGVKTWAFRTRIDRKPVKITLGRFDKEAFGVTTARQRAKEALAAAQKGERPNAKPAPPSLPAPAAALAVAFQTLPAQLPSVIEGSFEVVRDATENEGDPEPVRLVRDVWADYLRMHLEPTSKPSVKKFTSSMSYILPLWNDRPIKKIRRKDVMAVTDTALARGPEARNTTIVALSSFFNWCVTRDLVETSPVVVKKIVQPSRERVLTDAEIKTFWKGCNELGPVFGPMLQMLLLTGCLRNEVAAMRWDEIDGDVWTIPAARTKNRKRPGAMPLDITLTDEMKAILALMPRVEGCPFVFSTNGRTYSTGFSKAKLALDKLAPILEEWIFHDLRRTFTTGIGKLGVPQHIIDRCTGHGLDKVRKTYNRFTYASETAAAWKLWSDHVASLAKGRND